MHSSEGYSIKDYGSMIHDARRTAPFIEALRAAIRPGSVLLDIGTGTGIFSFMACEFGAARVYAIEPDSAIEVAKLCAKGIPGSERITWIQGLSTEIDLPEKVDVVIGDLHGTLPFHDGNIESLVDARKRHLKPGGRMLPSRDILHAVPAHAPDDYRYVESPWYRNDYGIDLSAAAPYVFNQWWHAATDQAPLEHLLAGAQCWGVIDYTTIETTSLDNRMEWEIERAGALHGLYVWFDGDLGEGIGYSNAPHLPKLVYGRAFFPFERTTDVMPGDTVRTRLAVTPVKGRYVWRWDSRITAADGTLKASFQQSTFKANLASPGELRKAAADYAPALTQAGEVTHAVLQAMSSGQRLQDIADIMVVRFPQRFGTVAQALDEVSRLSQKYG